MKKHFFIISFAFMLIHFPLIGNGMKESLVLPDQPDKEISGESSVLRLSGGDTGLPNPFRHHMRGPGMSKMWILYDSLLEKDEDGDIPWLAKSWDVDRDGTTFVFTLQENVYWHDGIPLTAEDVAFTFQYYKDHPPVYNLLVSKGEYIIESAEVIDDRNVKIRCNHFDNNNLTNIGYSRILPKHVWQDVSDPIRFQGEGTAVGSGPFRLDAYHPEQGTYRYAAFPDYWGLEPAVQRIEWIPASDEVMAFEQGEIDLLSASADLLTRYRDNPLYQVDTRPSYHSYRLLLNMEKRPELAQKRVRKALAYGINRQALVEKIFRGSASISSMGFVPSVSPWYNPDIESYEWDPDQSLSLLGGEEFQFKLLTGNALSDIKMAELIALDLDKIGVKVLVESVESKVRDNSVASGNYEILLINSGGMGGDPDYLSTYYGEASSQSGLNSTLIGYRNKEIQQLVSEQAHEIDSDKRKKEIFRLQELIADDVPMIMLAGAEVNFVYRPEVYDRWMYRYDHSMPSHNKLSYLIRK